MARYTTSRAALWAARSRLTRPFFDEGCSLREGQHGKQDVDLRLEEIQQFVAPKGWAVMAMYSVVASGVREEQTDFRRLTAGAPRARFEPVILQRFDRPANSVKQLGETLDHLRLCWVAFGSTKEDVDTSTPAGELIFHVMAAIGQFGRALIGDRIGSGA
jgi:DNA invertase Pin-like site-specific DNA recombinase